MNSERTFVAHSAHPVRSGPAAVGRPDGAPAIDSAYVAALERDLETYRAMYAESQGDLLKIRSSRGWLILCKCYQLRDRLLPAASRRGKIAKAALNAALAVARRAWRMAHRASPGKAEDPYTRWLRDNDPGPEELDRQRATRFPHPVRISVVTPTYETPPEFLKAMLQSVREQTYADWELCVADGASTAPEVRAILEDEAGRDPRIKLTFLPRNEGIAGNTAAALALATGDFVAFLDHDDLLAPSALFEVARAAHEDPDADILYSDEDKIDAAGRVRTGPHFKPDWSPDLLRSLNYVCHLAVYRRELVERVGGARPGFDGAQDYDLILRASERAKKIIHIPKILYHWRVHPGSTAQAVGVKNYAHEAGRRAVQEHLRRLGWEGTVTDGPAPTFFHTTYRLARRPLVSLLIPTRDQIDLLGRCLDSVARSTYDNIEVLLVENNSRDPLTFAYYRRLEGRPGVRLVTWERPFNYAAVNNWAAAQARGELLLFLNNDVEAITPDWIERMVEHAVRPEVGAVGAKLYFPNDTVQHAGVVLGLGGVAAHAHCSFPRSHLGYVGRLAVVQNFSAVTGACLMMRKDVFDKIGGFDEQFVLAYNDIDLCVRVRRAGHLIVWTPLAELYHHESATRGYETTPEKKARFQREVHRFLTKWGDLVWKGDPYYNPNLTRDSADFSLRF